MGLCKSVHPLPTFSNVKKYMIDQTMKVYLRHVVELLFWGYASDEWMASLSTADALES